MVSRTGSITVSTHSGTSYPPITAHMLARIGRPYCRLFATCGRVAARQETVCVGSVDGFVSCGRIEFGEDGRDVVFDRPG
jgi:hypothetical protein